MVGAAEEEKSDIEGLDPEKDSAFKEDRCDTEAPALENDSMILTWCTENALAIIIGIHLAQVTMMWHFGGNWAASRQELYRGRTL